MSGNDLIKRVACIIGKAHGVADCETDPCGICKSTAKAAITETFRHLMEPSPKMRACSSSVTSMVGETVHYAGADAKPLWQDMLRTATQETGIDLEPET